MYQRIPLMIMIMMICFLERGIEDARFVRSPSRRSHANSAKSSRALSRPGRDHVLEGALGCGEDRQ